MEVESNMLTASVTLSFLAPLANGIRCPGTKLLPQLGNLVQWATSIQYLGYALGYHKLPKIIFVLLPCLRNWSLVCTRNESLHLSDYQGRDQIEWLQNEHDEREKNIVESMVHF